MVVDNDALNLLSLSFFEFVVFGVIYIFVALMTVSTR